MKKYAAFIVMILVGLVCVFASVSNQKLVDIKEISQQAPAKKTPVAFGHNAVKPDIDFGKIPLYFITNKGQVDAQAKFYARASRYTLWLTKSGLVFDGSRPLNKGKQGLGSSKEKLMPGLHDVGEFERDVSRLVFQGASRNPEMVSLEESTLKVNYFKGKDKSKWNCGVPTSKAVLYKSLYKNVDLKVYGLEKQIEYDWIVKPTGDPGKIKFQYENVNGSRIDKEGNLLIETKFGELMHKKPFSYQHSPEAGSCTSSTTGSLSHSQKAGKRIPVDVRFKKLSENTYGFEVGEYDVNRELIIDPVVLAYSTYLGGSGVDRGYGVAVDSAGNVYVTGLAGGANFPLLNQYQDSRAYAFVAKLDMTRSGASSLIYSTYLGGGSLGYCWGIDVDDTGKAYVAGFTSASDFPVVNQYQTDNVGDDCIVAVLDTTKSGTASLLYSTYLGGDDYEVCKSIAVGPGGNVYVAGYTVSTDFPVFKQYQVNSEWGDAFVTVLDPTESGASSLLYSTYLGGEGSDSCEGIAVDAAGKVYVMGYTGSADFPTLQQYQAFQGDVDVFVTKLDTTKSGTASLVYSTFLGGGQGEWGKGIAVDSGGNAYVTGYTQSTDFPILHQYQGDQGGVDIFVAKLSPPQNGAVGLLYSTYLGGGEGDYAYGIAIDAAGCAYVTGFTNSTDFPTLNGYQAGSAHIFVAKLNSAQSGTSSLSYSTFLGNGASDKAYGIAADAAGNAYVVGYSSGFPVVNPYQAYQTEGDVVVAKLSFGRNYYFHGSDYNGDSRADIAIFRPSNGRWCVKGSPSVAWGTSGDIPVPGDYDGDGDTDIAIFRPSTGRWCIMGQPSVSWGTSTDIPVPGDYDGDGDTDIAIFRPSNGRWCIMGQPSVAWGVSTDIPVPADYDGDGDTDIAVFRASLGRWCIMGQSSIGWGISTDIPVPADYDGDGDTDIAIFRPSTGRWCIMGQPSVAWGVSTDIAVPADYDGDGDDDIAIFRPSNGRWAIMGVPSEVYGTSTDVPLVSHKGK
ncbi:MAG: hypothetical protein GY765_19785 [bacterium]|nr:hypothetical protein [bacterium]